MSEATQLASMPPGAFLRLPAVLACTALKRSTIYDLIQRGKFPAPEKLTSHASGWRVSSVAAWLSDPAGWKASAKANHSQDAHS